MAISPKNMHYLILLLVGTQAMHSVEEYYTKLWEVLPIAAFLTGIFSDDLEKGFLIINISLFVIGLISWQYVKNNLDRTSFALIWFWIILEFTNGVGHNVWALIEGSYVSGQITAIALFFISVSSAIIYIKAHKLKI